MHKTKKGWEKINSKTFQVENLKTVCSFFGLLWFYLEYPFVKFQPVFLCQPPKCQNFDDCWVHSFWRIGWTVNIDDSSSSEAPEKSSAIVTQRRFGGGKTLGNPKEFLQKIGGTLGKVRGITNPVLKNPMIFETGGKGRFFGGYLLFTSVGSPWGDNQPFSKWLYNNYPKKKR